MSRMQRLFCVRENENAHTVFRCVATRVASDAAQTQPVVSPHSLQQVESTAPLELQRGAAHTQSTLSSTAGESPLALDPQMGIYSRAHQRHDPRQHVYGARKVRAVLSPSSSPSPLLAVFFFAMPPTSVSATRVTSGHAWICTLSLAAVSSQTHCMYVRQPPLIHARDARGRGRRRRRESSMRAATTSGCHRRHPIHAPLPLSVISRPR